MEIIENKFIKEKFNTKLLKFVLVILLSVFLIGINNTFIYYSNLRPFGIGIVFSLLFVGFNGYLLATIYLITAIVFNLELFSILIGINVSLVVSIIWWLKENKNFKINKLKIYISSLISLTMYIVLGFGDTKETLAMIVSVILAMLFLYCCLVFFDATINKGMYAHINLDEKICGCILLIIFALGIGNTNIYYINLGLLFSVIIIEVASRLCGVGATLVTGVLLGIGFSILNLDPIYVSMYVVLSLSVVAFKCNYKILGIISYVISYILFGLFFGVGLSLWEVISVCIGGIICLFIPVKFLSRFSEFFSKTKPVAIQNIFNGIKKEFKERIKDLSLVFNDMDKVYRDMVRGNLTNDQAKIVLKEELISGVCKNCNRFENCFREFGSFMDNCFETFVGLGYDKEKLLLIDLPEYLTSNCTKVNILVQYFNNLLSSYVDYRNSVDNLDTSRILIADQLCGVSRLLESLSNEFNVELDISNRLSETIKELLSYHGIICLECVVYENNINDIIINLTVKNLNIDNNKIEKLISKKLKKRYKIYKIDEGVDVGVLSLVLKSTPNYDIAFGSSVSTKTGKIVSGDNYSIVPIDNSKYIVSICDGMGSGKEANTISKLTIKLIENFYKAGFDNEIILNSINKLLSLNEEENFSTIDFCMIDCKKNIYDFIKLGACKGYIKRASGEVEIIDSSGLPIGVLDNIKPHITKQFICNMDMVVFVSDGVEDVLGDDLQKFIKFSDAINPQELSNEILNKALELQSGVAEDDMTVVCIRVFEYV